MSFFDRIRTSTQAESRPQTDRRNAGEPPSAGDCWLAREFHECLEIPRRTQALDRLCLIYRMSRCDYYDRDHQAPTEMDARRALLMADWGVLSWPNSPVPWFEVFMAMMLGARPAHEARPRMTHSLDEAIRRAPRWVEGHCIKTWFYRVQRREYENFRLARLAGEAAIALSPHHEWALNELAMLYNKYDHFADELECYRNLAQHFPENGRYGRAVAELSQLRSRQSVPVR